MSKTLIVIPCLNEQAYLEKLIDQLVIDTSTLDVRIIIVDGCSSDRTPVIAKELAKKYANIIYLLNPKKLQSAAINLAVTTFADDAEYLIRIDAHADYPSNFCQMLLQEAHEKNANSVVVAMHTVGKEGFQKSVAAAQNSKLGNGGSAHRNITGDGLWVEHGHHALMEIAAFQKISGYDESFSHNEDAELDYRLAQAGYKIWLTHKTSLTYYPRTCPTSLFRQYFKFGQGRARTLFKHHIRPKPRQMAPLVVVPAALLFFMSFLGYAMLSLPFLGWASLCTLYGIAIARKANDNNLYLTGPAIMIMHFSWSLGFWTFMFNRFILRTK